MIDRSIPAESAAGTVIRLCDRCSGKKEARPRERTAVPSLPVPLVRRDISGSGGQFGVLSKASLFFRSGAGHKLSGSSGSPAD